MAEGMQIKFYGTRGSLPAPLTAGKVRQKIIGAIIHWTEHLAVSKLESHKPDSFEVEEFFDSSLSLADWGTYGGNTTCCVVRCGQTIIVFDLGSGVRQFGQDILGEMFKSQGVLIHFCMSHVHWDHIQGFPFFAPLFISRKKLPKNRFVFFGGVAWQGALEEALRGQMDAPVFPVEWDKVTTEGPGMKFLTICDGFETQIAHGKEGETLPDAVKLRAQRLHHPNETYGWRIEYNGKVFVFASDTEPFAGGPDPVILDLAKDADALYLDCQFTEKQYLGQEGVPRLGWGHGYDTWCAQVAKQAGVKRLYLGHHDPAASDEKIFSIQQQVKASFAETVAAYDGLEIEI